jgi:glyoxylase-like metal-dependent hydrolase (beta-lactamase superfamily II)
MGSLACGTLHTPGHTPGAQCLHVGGALFTGDTLFVNKCGRCDFVGGNPSAMFHSLHQVIGALPDGTTVYPGHDYGDVKVSTLGRERAQNPYLSLKDEASFIAFRMKPAT